MTNPWKFKLLSCVILLTPRHSAWNAWAHAGTKVVKKAHTALHVVAKSTSTITTIPLTLEGVNEGIHWPQRENAKLKATARHVDKKRTENCLPDFNDTPRKFGVSHKHARPHVHPATPTPKRVICDLVEPLGGTRTAAETAKGSNDEAWSCRCSGSARIHKQLRGCDAC